MECVSESGSGNQTDVDKQLTVLFKSIEPTDSNKASENDLGEPPDIPWVHIFSDMKEKWQTMIVIQNEEEMLDDGKNIMATCGVLAALILSFMFGAEPPTLNRYSVWVFFGDYDNFVAEVYNTFVLVLDMTCTAEVLVTTRAYIALCLVPPEGGRMMGFRMGSDVMMGWNFAIFGVIAVCIGSLLLLHASMVLRWGSAIVVCLLVLVAFVHTVFIIQKIDDAAFSVNKACESGVEDETAREGARDARIGKWSVAMVVEWILSGEGSGFDELEMSKTFKKIDTNTDNEISEKELGSHLNQLQSESNSKISPNELSRRAAVLYAKINTNQKRSNAIDFTEFCEAVQLESRLALAKISQDQRKIAAQAFEAQQVDGDLMLTWTSKEDIQQDVDIPAGTANHLWAAIEALFEENSVLTKEESVSGQTDKDSSQGTWGVSEQEDDPQVRPAEIDAKTIDTSVEALERQLLPGAPLAEDNGVPVQPDPPPLTKVTPPRRNKTGES
eukprot:COSAG02_NODE_88_length_38629_cov_457.967999_8_plen_499_part_00